MDSLAARLRLLQFLLYRQYTLCQKRDFETALALYPRIEKELDMIETWQVENPKESVKRGKEKRIKRIRTRCQELNRQIGNLLTGERDLLARERLSLLVDRELRRLENGKA